MGDTDGDGAADLVIRLTDMLRWWRRISWSDSDAPGRLCTGPGGRDTAMNASLPEIRRIA